MTHASLALARVRWKRRRGEPGVLLALSLTPTIACNAPDVLRTEAALVARPSWAGPP